MNQIDTQSPAPRPQAPVSAPAADPAGKAKLSWIPIRSLSERHRSRILAHLLDLPEQDRYLRFGYAASDSQITHYVDQLDFERDEVLGIFNRRLRLLAMAHLAYLSTNDGKPAAKAEFGVSVAARARGRGYGSRLFDLAVLHARNRGVQTLIVHALSENSAMLRIARNAGAEVVREGGESEASLRLPPETLASHVEQIVEDSVAEIDYQIKHQARRVGDLLHTLASIAGIESNDDAKPS
ncbi:MAG: GNAT family N-acetyltransferase [Burkholderiaceae bacterium]